MSAYFLEKNINSTDSHFTISEETAKHLIQVLRKQVGYTFNIINGKGLKLEVAIIEINKKNVLVKTIQANEYEPKKYKNIIAIGLIKNTNRFEWFLEKVTEFGIDTIIPLITQRTEKNQFKYERLKNIVSSAVLQSQQIFVPDLLEPINFSTLDWNTYSNYHKYIAHCELDNEKINLDKIDKLNNNIIFIGPEGDFTSEEITKAKENNCNPLSLGNNRLRTETAGVLAAGFLYSQQ